MGNQTDMKVRLQYEASGDVLKSFYHSRAKIQSIRGPVGSGKTTAVIYKILNLMMNMPTNNNGVKASQWVAVRNTYGDLARTTVKDWHMVLDNYIFPHPDYQLGLRRKNPIYCDILDGFYTKKTQKKVMDLTDGKGVPIRAEIQFMALDKIGEVEKAVQAIAGLHITGAWVSECRFVPWRAVGALRNRLGRYPGIRDFPPEKQEEKERRELAGLIHRPTPYPSMILMDTNSAFEDSWYPQKEDEAIKGCKRKKARRYFPHPMEFFVQPGGIVRDDLGKWQENPEAENIQNLPNGYYRDSISTASFTDLNETRMNLANEYGIRKTGLAVFDNYNDEFHIDDSLMYNQSPLILGVDYGKEAACVILQWDSKEKPTQLRVMEEFCVQKGESTTIAQWGPKLQGVISRIMSTHNILEYHGMGDPAGDHMESNHGSVSRKLLRGAGVEVRNATTNNLVARLAGVARMLGENNGGQPTLVIHPRCLMLRQALGGRYHYSERQTAKDEPVKNAYSHVADALQYAVQAAGIKPLRSYNHHYHVQREEKQQSRGAYKTQSPSRQRRSWMSA